MFFAGNFEDWQWGWGVLHRKDGVGRQGKRLFYFGRRWRHSPPHPRLSLYTPPVETPAPSAPGQTAHDRQQHRPCQMQGRPCKARHTRPGAGHAAPSRSGKRRGPECLRSASDRPRPNGQNNCKQKYSFFMCKPLDKRNKIVYNIDSKQTYLHHHKTGGQNHEVRI